jgi:tripartite-type tricarboxylate transporter receptor subunit TctC
VSYRYTAAAGAAFITCTALTPGVLAGEAAYPVRPVRVVVASAPGGGLDAVTRIIAPRLHESTGQPWIVDNRSGAGGNVGAEIVARATPDGYTALASTSTLLTVNPSLYKMSFSVEKDLQPITILASGEQVVVVHPSVAAKTIQDLVALAKQKPGALNYASAGTGTAIHLGAELLKLRAGIDITQVPYKGGGPAAAAVVSGEVQVLVGTVASAIPFIQSGRVRALATTGAKRSKLLPDLPTVAESGYPGFEAGLWFAMTMPRGTPKSVVDRVNSETAKVLQQREVESMMSRQGLDPEPSTPAELSARIRKETATWAAVIRKAGIKVE